MLQQNSETNQSYQSTQIVDYHRNLQRAVVDAAARFLGLNPQWAEYFFNLDFLLNRGLLIVERHIAGVDSNSAIDLALAWAQEWPSMNMSQRKVCLQAQTVIAAELLRLVTQEVLVSRAPYLVSRAPYEVLNQERDKHWRGMSVPFAYVKSHNPPGHSDVHLQQMLDTVAQHQREKEDCVDPRSAD